MRFREGTEDYNVRLPTITGGGVFFTNDTRSKNDERKNFSIDVFRNDRYEFIRKVPSGALASLREKTFWWNASRSGDKNFVATTAV